MKLVGTERSKGINRHTIKTFEENGRKLHVNRNHDVGGNQFYIYEEYGGEGCQTIWYPTLDAAKQEVERLFETGDKVVTGRDSGLCKECQNSYSPGSKGWKKYPAFRCRPFKMEKANPKPTLEDYRKQIKLRSHKEQGDDRCTCGYKGLSKLPIEHYAHSGGWPVQVLVHRP